MSLSDFIQVEREIEGELRIHLIHTVDPRLVVEFLPVRDSQGRVVSGTIKRVCMNNSVYGDYKKCGKLISLAEKFLRRSLAGESPSSFREA